MIGKKKEKIKKEKIKRVYDEWSTEPTSVEMMLLDYWTSLLPKVRILIIAVFSLMVFSLIVAGVISIFGW